MNIQGAFLFPPFCSDRCWHTGNYSIGERKGKVNRKEGKELREILIPAIVSSIVSIIFCQIASTYIFRSTSAYVDEMIKLMQQIIKDIEDKNSAE
jgi:hypothetical protein